MLKLVPSGFLIYNTQIKECVYRKVEIKIGIFTLIQGPILITSDKMTIYFC